MQDSMDIVQYYQSIDRMGFPYLVELQNIDTSQKYIHPILSIEKDQLFNENQEINYESIEQIILMYEPQCEKDMLLIMYLKEQAWAFMTSKFSIDLKKIVQTDEASDKITMNKHGSKFQSHSQLQSHTINSKIQSQKGKVILSIRFQCQLWVQESQKKVQRISLQNSQKDRGNFNLFQKIKEIKKKINQIEQFSQELHEIQTQALGINIFWANPYYSTDGIQRKYINDLKKRDKQSEQKQFLKNSVKCIPYINTIAQQIKQSDKKIVLNIDQFNRLSFARRNIFNVVYLVCHTQVTEIKKNEVEQKFHQNHAQLITDQESQISDASEKNDVVMNFLDEKEKKDEKNSYGYGQINNLQFVVPRDQCQPQIDQNQENDVPTSLEQKKNDCFQIKRIDQPFLLDMIDEEKESDNMTQRKQSHDFIFMRENGENFSSQILQENQVPKQIEKRKSKPENPTKKNHLQQPIAHSNNLQNNLLSFGQEKKQMDNVQSIHQYEYDLTKLDKANVRRNKFSRSNSFKSISSAGKKNRSRSSSKKNFRGDSFNSIPKTYEEQIPQYKDQTKFNLPHSSVRRQKKNQRKLQIKQRKKNAKQSQNKSQQNKQKQAVTYFVGQNKYGEIQKITPHALDEMLSERKLQNIELFIVHSSYPNAHLPVLKKHANNILLINSNPMYPEACTFFFLRYFFKHLLETKSIKEAHQKALSQTSYLYKKQSENFDDLKFSTFYSSERQPLQRLSFDPIMQKINDKYLNGGPYTCCCYHKHENQCIFKKEKTTSKYAEAHFKFHVNRCNCRFPNLMEHSCKQKKKTLGEYNIIDKKDYHSEMVYNCCCWGVRLGKYKEREKNKEYIGIVDQEYKDDPHELTHKYIFLPTALPSNKDNSIFEQDVVNTEKSISKNLDYKYCLKIYDGSVQGSFTGQFQASIKYLSGNDLQGNTEVLVGILSFFGRENQINGNQSQIREGGFNKNKDGIVQNELNTIPLNQSKKLMRMTNSMIRQSIIPNTNEQKSQIKRNQSLVPWVCNMHGQNSSGRKTISKYVAHLMIVRKMFQKVEIKYFTKVQDLKFIEIDEKVSTFYILVYKSSKRYQQSSQDQIIVNASNLPNSIRCIMVTNNQIIFDKNTKHTFRKPNPLGKKEMKTYIKLYEHLNPVLKLKLNDFMDLSDLNQKSKREKDSDKNFMKIYANRIDSYEIISIIKKSNYKNSKYKSYLQNVAKIHPVGLPSYIFIAGIIFQTLKEFSFSSIKSERKRKQFFVQNITTKLRFFMNQNKSFFLFFDPKRNKNKSKKQKDENKKNESKGIEGDYELEKLLQNVQQNPSHKYRQQKQQLIKEINISKFYFLLFQKFRKQISYQPLNALKAYIYFTTIHQNGIFSLKNSQYSKGSQNFYYQNISENVNQYRTRKIVYQPQFYQATSLNKSSFLYKVLSSEIAQYGSLFNDEPLKNETKVISQPNNEIQTLSQQILEGDENQMNQFKLPKRTESDVFQHQRYSLNEFFSSYVQIFKAKSPHEVCQTKQTSSSKSIPSHESHAEFTPKKQSHQSFQCSKGENLSLPHKEKKSSNFTQKRKEFEINPAKSKEFNFEQDQKHLHCIVSAGLSYLRSIICSHLIYDLLETNQIIKFLKAALLLINNAIILMKSSSFRYQEHESFQNDYNSDRESQSNGSMSSDSSHYEQFDCLNNRKTENLSFFRKQSQDKFGISQAVKSKAKQQGIRMRQTIQKQLNRPFSRKGLLYLLFKIHQRCDCIILTSTNQNRNQEAQLASKISIISELLTLQIHIANLYTGENYETAISKLNDSQKVEKYLAQIFYGKGRSLNYIKESIRFANQNSKEEEAIQNHILSAYIMITTDCGRKKINENLCQKITKIKNQFVQKAPRKESVRAPHTFDENSLSPKMRILYKVSENKQIFLQIFSIFKNFESEKKSNECPKGMKSKKSGQSALAKDTEKQHSESNFSNVQNGSQMGQSRTICVKHYESESQIYLRLMEIWQDFDQLIHNAQPDKIYVSIERYRIELLDKEMVHCLRFCSRYINQFYSDLVQKIQGEISHLKEKLIVFLSADPIEFTNSKESLSEFTDDFQLYKEPKQYKRKALYELTNKTIILGSDINQFNSTLQRIISNVNSLPDSEEQAQHEKHRNSNKQLQDQSELISQTKRHYKHFALKRKLNENNLKQLSNSQGCEYMCIDTTVCMNDQKNEIIGENQKGEIIIFRKQHLAQLIEDVPASVLFICLHNKYLGNEVKQRYYRKEIIYFNFDKITSEGSSRGQKKVQQGLLYTYYRMIMRKVVHLILQHIISNTSNDRHILKLHQAIVQVVNGNQFSIKNQLGQTVFFLSTEELKKSIVFQRQRTLNQLQQHKPPTLVTLSEEDIVSVDQVQEVQAVLKHKNNIHRQYKGPIKIQIKHIEDFEKLYNIFKFYLKDKENYQEFALINLEDFRFPNKYNDGFLNLKEKKSGQSDLSIPESLTQLTSSFSNASSQRQKKEKKGKESKNEPIKYTHTWKSEFVSYLLKQNLLNLFLSNKKCLIMFQNSDLINEKSEKQQWAKIIFENLFKIANCDNGESLNRTVTEVKVSIQKKGEKKGEKKVSKHATLFFIETKISSNQ